MKFPGGNNSALRRSIRQIISRSGIIALFRRAGSIIFPLGKMDSNALGRIVREERKAQGLRQQELAAACGVGVRFIVDLEAGKPTLQVGKALQVLATLGCDVSIATPARVK
ncbi:helix-turn-helix domain-containing protein [Sphingobium ummariense]